MANGVVFQRFPFGIAFFAEDLGDKLIVDYRSGFPSGCVAVQIYSGSGKIIFDLDGVFADAERFDLARLLELVKRVGVRVLFFLESLAIFGDVGNAGEHDHQLEQIYLGVEVGEGLSVGFCENNEVACEIKF